MSNTPGPTRRMTDNTAAMALLDRAGTLTAEDVPAFYEWANGVLFTLVGSGRTVHPDMLALIARGRADPAAATPEDQRRLAGWARSEISRGDGVRPS